MKRYQVGARPDDIALCCDQRRPAAVNPSLRASHCDPKGASHASSASSLAARASHLIACWSARNPHRHGRLRALLASRNHDRRLGGASTGPTATATTPGEVSGGTTTGPTATPTKKPPTPTKTATPGGIICCLTVILLPSVHQVLQQQTLTGTSVGPVTVTCPAGEVALSGSWATNPSDGSNALVYNSSRNGAGGWRVYVQHSGSTLVNAYAMCLKNASGATVAERYAGSLSVNPGTYGTKYASCNAGETLVGGAFASSNGLTLYNFAASGSTWGGYVWNHTGSRAALQLLRRMPHLLRLPQQPHQLCPGHRTYGLECLPQRELGERRWLRRKPQQHVYHHVGGLQRPGVGGLRHARLAAQRLRDVPRILIVVLTSSVALKGSQRRPGVPLPLPRGEGGACRARVLRARAR